MSDKRIIIPEGAHSILGPSSADRWLNCPGSVLQPGPNPKTEYAAEGNAAHTLSEWCRETGKPAVTWKGYTLVVEPFEFRVGKSMINSVQTFVDYVEGLPGARLIEERLPYDQIVEGGFGTCDDARLHLDACNLTDFKHGKGVEVSASGNSQLRLYALGVLFAYDWLYRFRKFILRICQPRRGVDPRSEYEELSAGELLQWGYDVARPGAVRALTPGAELKAGPWCKFCKVKDSCATRAAYKAQYDRSPDSPDEAFINLED